MPTDPTTVSALATIAQATIVGTFLVLLTLGVYRHKREVEREQQATTDAVKRENDANARGDKVLAHLERVSAGLDRLVVAIDKLATK